MKKAEIIILEKLVSIDKARELIDKKIYPLAIKKETTNNEIIKEYYSDYLDKDILVLNGYYIRDLIERKKIYVSKFIDENGNVKYIDFIAPSYGYELASPKLVFRKNPRLLFPTLDHFSLKKRYEGTDIIDIENKLIKTKNS